MPKITFIEPDGTRREVDAVSGDSTMQAAIHNGVEGIIGECGGSCICATCHCYVDEAWSQRIGPPGPAEADVLEFEAHLVRSESRLACQITITNALESRNRTSLRRCGSSFAPKAHCTRLYAPNGRKRW